MEEHIAHYKRLLAADPRNIDAYLRLGALWRTQGQAAQAVGAYNAAARLLSEEGLELEAIAACRAVFEIDPGHFETKLFLARLFANQQSANAPSRVVSVIEAPPAEAEEVIVLTADDAINEIGVEELEDLQLPDRRRAVALVERPGETIELDEADLIEALEGSDDAFSVEGSTEGFEGIEDLVRGSIQNVLDQSAPMVTGRPAAAAEPDEDPVDLEEDPSMVIEGVEIPNTPLFSRLPPGTFMTLLKRMNVRRVREGECIIQENVRHNTLSIILSGSVRIERRTPDGILALAQMGRGEFFGEFELLTGQEPKVVVRAETPVALLEIPQSLIAKIAEKDPTIWQVLWNFYHERLLNNLLAGSSLFMSLNGQERAALATEFKRVEAGADQTIMRQGQASEGLYLIARGEVVVKHDQEASSQVVATLREGDFFGTVSSLTRSPVRATVRATRDTTLLFLRRARLAALGQRHPEVDVALRRLVAYRQIVVGKTGYSTLGLPK